MVLGDGSTQLLKQTMEARATLDKGLRLQSTKLGRIGQDNAERFVDTGSSPTFLLREARALIEWSRIQVIKILRINVF